MSSGFVPASSSSSAVPVTDSPQTASTETTSTQTTSDDDAWSAARAAVSSNLSSSSTAQDPNDSRSLYDILQANKAAKQEAFEEKLKFKNQFKPLDEGDVEYLDSLIDSQRRAQQQRRREEEENLDAFRRRQQEAVEVKPNGEDADGVTWGKRKRSKGEKEGRNRLGVKVRRASTGDRLEVGSGDHSANVKGELHKTREVATAGTGTVKSGMKEMKSGAKEVKKVQEVESPQKDSKETKPAGLGLGLGDYGSDDDD